MSGRLPPFAKDLKRLDGAVWIYCGKSAWKVRDKQKAKDSIILFPCDREPMAYKWPVRDATVFILGLQAELKPCAQLVVCCLDAGAAAVWFIHDALEQGITHYRGRERHKRCA